jgi:hypothetical protein
MADVESSCGVTARIRIVDHFTWLSLILPLVVTEKCGGI